MKIGNGCVKGGPDIGFSNHRVAVPGNSSFEYKEEDESGQVVGNRWISVAMFDQLQAVFKLPAMGVGK